jgi:hypothetical protein
MRENEVKLIQGKMFLDGILSLSLSLSAVESAASLTKPALSRGMKQV